MRKIHQTLRWHPLDPGDAGGVPYVVNLYFHLWAIDEAGPHPHTASWHCVLAAYPYALAAASYRHGVLTVRSQRYRYALASFSFLASV
jgi:hypothetical protein